MRVLRLLAILSLGAIIFVMWYPQRYLFGVDLGSQALQDGAFSACTFFWILARGGRLRSDPYYEFRSSSQTIDAIPVKRNVLQIVSELVLLASLLEFGQQLLPNRVSAFDDFLVNSISVIAVGALCYVVIAMALRTAYGRRFVQYLVTLD
jgi:hypothetical protein